MNAGSTVWILPRVCGQWRSLALSLSRLWSTVRVSPDDFTIEQAPLQLGIQLYRAGCHPLSISLYTRRPLYYRDPIVQTLLPTSPRWKDLMIIGPSIAFSAFSSLRGFLPSIQTLHLWMLSTEFDSHLVALEQKALIAYEFTPNLRHLKGNPYLLTKCILPYANVVSYECHIETSFTCCSTMTLLALLVRFWVLGRASALRCSERSCDCR